MVGVRVIPCLLLKGGGLVKTVKFKNPGYIGDPVNTVRIFNELEVDELMMLDIDASRNKRKPNIKILKEIANECFMPVSYGGGIRSLEEAREILRIGLEKISVNTAFLENPGFARVLADEFGSQSVIGSIDVKKSLFGAKQVFSRTVKKPKYKSPLDMAKALAENGVGELLINSVDREGTWNGFDLELIQEIASEVEVPVIASGGAGSVNDIEDVVNQSNASAVALGSMVVYGAKGLGVLVSYPKKEKLERIFNEKKSV